jgi:two-component system chemotaxis response regulator CheB
VYALIVDDSKPVRSILTKVLESLSFKCHEAANGLEALDQLAHMPRPTIVTLNRHMPEMDGFELLGRLRRSKQFRDLTVVMISTDSDHASRTAATSLGANAFLAKPFTPSEFVSGLQALGISTEKKQSLHATSASGRTTTPPPAPVHPSVDSPAIRLLIVDDSSTIRSLLTKTINAVDGMTVAGTAADGKKALAFLDAESVDAVLLDIEMPVMDGLETLKAIRLRDPRLPVVMFSTLTERGARATLDALVAGATDYVPKPTGGDATAVIKRIESDLIPKIHAIAKRRLRKKPLAKAVIPPTDTQAPPSPAKPPESRSKRTAAVVIAVSTGGPSALSEVLPHLVSPTTPPVIIVQHMPAEFTSHLAERLSKICGHPVREATEGHLVQPGDVLLAPGGIHTDLVRSGRNVRIALRDTPPVNSCRPSADVLFRSSAQIYGADTLALVLTGMGSDGLLGCRDIVGQSGTVFAQDEASSVVWGMPGQVVRHGLATKILPLSQIGPEIAMRLRMQKK